jgi:hypothetical protein
MSKEFRVVREERKPAEPKEFRVVREERKPSERREYRVVNNFGTRCKCVRCAIRPYGKTSPDLKVVCSTQLIGASRSHGLRLYPALPEWRCGA